MRKVYLIPASELDFDKLKRIYDEIKAAPGGVSREEAKDASKPIDGTPHGSR